ncbi:MAG: hypothetical protein ACK5IC_09610 [Moheibacter sp.]
MKPEKKFSILIEDPLEKLIYETLEKNNTPILISELKEKVNVSNKKFDKTTKSMIDKGLLKFIKNEEGVFYEHMIKGIE